MCKPWIAITQNLLKSQEFYIHSSWAEKQEGVISIEDELYQYEAIFAIILHFTIKNVLCNMFRALNLNMIFKLENFALLGDHYISTFFPRRLSLMVFTFSSIIVVPPLRFWREKNFLLQNMILKVLIPHSTSYLSPHYLDRCKSGTKKCVKFATKIRFQ